MTYVDFRESRYTLFSKRSGLKIRVLNRTFGGQAQYFWPLFEYKLKVSESDQVGDFNPKTASKEEIETALRSSSPRVRMRAIIALASRFDIELDTLLHIASLFTDRGNWDYEFGKHYGPSRFCPTVNFCAAVYLPVLMHNSPATTIDMTTKFLEFSEPMRFQIIAALNSIEAVGAVAAALVLNDPADSETLALVSEAMKDQLPDIAGILSTFADPLEERPARVAAYLASKEKSEAILNDYTTTLIRSDIRDKTWILEGIPLQTSKEKCEQLASICGEAAMPYLERGITGTSKKAQRACKYARSKMETKSRVGKTQGTFDPPFRRSFWSRWFKA